MHPLPLDAVARESNIQAIDKAVAAIQDDTGALGDGKRYRGRWTRRATLEGERMACGADGSFSVPRDMSVRRFAKLFPDQNDHLLCWPAT